MSKQKNKNSINPQWPGIFNSLFVPVLIVNNSADILFANKHALKIFNCSLKYLQNAGTSKLLPCFNKKTLLKLKRLKNIELNGRSKNGKTLFFEISLSILKHAGINYGVLFLHNISKSIMLMEERDKHKIEAEKYSHKLASIMENADILLWSVKEDVNGGLYYEQVNKAFAAATGRKPSAYNGKLLKELGSKEDYIEVVKSLNKAKELGVYIYEKQLRHGRAVKYFIIRIIAVPSLKGASNHFIGSATDITDTKLAQQQLILEKNKASIYFDTAKVLLVVIDNSGRISLINKMGCDVLGLSEKELIGKNWFNNFIPAAKREELKKIFRKLIRGENSPSEFFENIVLGKNNSERYVLWHNTILKDDKGKISGLLCSGEDITDRMHMEELLKQSEKKYRELARNAPVAVARLDASSDKYEFVNDEFVNQCGYTLEEFNKLTKREVYEIVHPEDRDALYALFKEWAKRGFHGTFHYEYRIINKYRKLLWLEVYFYPEFDSKNKLLAVNQIYIDITCRKKAEANLQILGHAIESTTEMISITDLNNRFTFVNKAFENKYGYCEREIIGKEVEILGSVKNLPEIHDIVFKNTKKGGWEGELVNTRKDRTEFPILLSTSQIKNSEGDVMGYIGVARDITELKNTYDRLRHSLKEKDILLKEVYHRVKNNMQIISSLLSIQSQSVTEPAAIELFKETQNRVRIMQLIHEKLYKSQDLTKIDFSLYIRDLTDQLKRAYPVSRNIELNINSEGIYLGVDRAIPCGLIINELVSNAYKYAFTKIVNGYIYIELTLQNDKHVLVVSDNGVGIPEYVNFRETDSLGMILISTLSDQLEGSVEIDRTEGTKFTIRF